MKQIIFIFLLTTYYINANTSKEKSSISSQEELSTKMGQTTLEELKMIKYIKDTIAGAVVLYEHANYYTSPKHEYQSKTDFYYRIKIFDATKFNLATVELFLFKKKKALSIKAITYNLGDNNFIEKSYLKDSEIFKKDETKDYKSISFTLPNIKEGSVIEYSYSIISPYLSITDWYFQSSIPKIKSEFDAAILGNYKYNVRTIGNEKLDKNDTSIKKRCIYVDGIGDGACAIYSFGMSEIPAFKEENYMLSKKNYLSRLSFDLRTYTTFRGLKTDYSKTWKDADQTIKKQFFNNQTSKKSFFKKRIPNSILTESNKLQKAKRVFNFIRNHYTWNNKNWTNEDAKPKTAFNEKSGGVAEINLSLYNSLKAAKIDAFLMVLSTRDNGLPTQLYPIIYDFNYVIVKVIVDKREYFLDATDKFLDFGELPERCLNGYGRVLDFKNKSYWQYIKPKLNTAQNISSKLVLDKNGNISGNMLITTTGYFAAIERKKISLTTNDSYLENIEVKNPNLEINDITLENLDSLSKPLIQNLKVDLESSQNSNSKINFYPFFYDKIKENPFKLNKRNYPVDFGYPRKYNYGISLTVPKEYKVENLPKKKVVSLPNKGGRFIVSSSVKDNIVNIYFRINIRKNIYSEEEYFYLKEFFNKIIQVEKSYFTLKKL